MKYHELSPIQHRIVVEFFENVGNVNGLIAWFEEQVTLDEVTLDKDTKLVFIVEYSSDYPGAGACYKVTKNGEFKSIWGFKVD